MSDTTAQQFAQEGQPVENPAMTLSITLHPDGSMAFAFPANEILSYGLLEKARAKLDELALVRAAQHAQQRVQASRGGMNGLLKKLHGG